MLAWEIVATVVGAAIIPSMVGFMALVNYFEKKQSQRALTTTGATSVFDQLEMNAAYFGSLKPSEAWKNTRFNESGMVVGKSRIPNVCEAMYYFSYTLRQFSHAVLSASASEDGTPSTPTTIPPIDERAKNKFLHEFSVLEDILDDHEEHVLTPAVRQELEVLRELVLNIETCEDVRDLVKVTKNLWETLKQAAQDAQCQQTFPPAADDNVVSSRLLTQGLLRHQFEGSTKLTDLAVEGWKDEKHDVLLEGATPLYLYCLGTDRLVSGSEWSEQDLELLRENFFNTTGLTDPVRPVLNAPLARALECEAAVTPYGMMLLRRYGNKKGSNVREEDALKLMEKEKTTAAACKHVYPHRLLPAFFFMITVGCLLLLDLRFVHPPRSPAKESFLEQIIEDCLDSYSTTIALFDDLATNKTLADCPIQPTNALFSMRSVTPTMITTSYNELALKDVNASLIKDRGAYSFVRALFFRVEAAYRVAEHGFEDETTAFIEVSLPGADAPNNETATYSYRFIPSAPSGDDDLIGFWIVLGFMIPICLYRLLAVFIVNEKTIASAIPFTLGMIGFVAACLGLNAHYAGWLSCIGACFFSFCGFVSETYFLIRDMKWKWAFHDYHGRRSDDFIKHSINAGDEVVKLLSSERHYYVWTSKRVGSRCAWLFLSAGAFGYVLSLAVLFNKCTKDLDDWNDADSFQGLTQALTALLHVFAMLIFSTAHLMTNVVALYCVMAGVGVAGCVVFAAVSDPTMNAVMTHVWKMEISSIPTIVIVVYLSRVWLASKSVDVNLEKRLTLVFDLGCNISRPYNNLRHVHFAAHPIKGFLFLVGVFVATTIYRATSYSTPSSDRGAFQDTVSSSNAAVYSVAKSFLEPIIGTFA